MAGQQKFRAFCARIEAEGGDDVILDRIATGEKMRLISADYGCSDRQIYHWRDQNKGRKAAWKAARKIAAHRMAEDALDIADDAKPITSAEAGMLKEQIGMRKWLAELWNRDEYGSGKQVVDVNLNFGDLQLEALKAGGARPVPQLEQGIPEAEIKFLPSDDVSDELPTDEKDELYGLVAD